MGKVYDLAKEFKKRYPGTVCWRLKQNARVIEKHLNPDEEVTYAFAAQKNDDFFDIISTAVVCITNKRIIIGRKRVMFGYFMDTITPDLFNDLKILSGIVWGKIYVDTVKELVVFSNISKKALDEIETQITEFMMSKKVEMGLVRE